MSKLVKESDLKSDGESLMGSSPIARTILELYPNFHTVYGPYTRKDGREIVILYDGKRRSARQYARVLLEVKLKRRLTERETVDHIDGNFNNNEISNLQVLSRVENAAKSAVVKVVRGRCDTCGKTFTLSKNQRNKRADNKRKFCSAECKFVAFRRTNTTRDVSSDGRAADF